MKRKEETHSQHSPHSGKEEKSLARALSGKSTHIEHIIHTLLSIHIFNVNFYFIGSKCSLFLRSINDIRQFEMCAYNRTMFHFAKSNEELPVRLPMRQCVIWFLFIHLYFVFFFILVHFFFITRWPCHLIGVIVFFSLSLHFASIPFFMMNALPLHTRVQCAVNCFGHCHHVIMAVRNFSFKLNLNSSSFLCFVVTDVDSMIIHRNILLVTVQLFGISSPIVSGMNKTRTNSSSTAQCFSALWESYIIISDLG